MQTKTLFTYESPLSTKVQIHKQTFAPEVGKPTATLSVLAGLHGDELEGVYVCYLLSQYLQTLQKDDPQALAGTVHIYPAVNPQAVSYGTRLSPFFSVDMNRTLGGGEGTTIPHKASHELFEDLRIGSDFVVDIHSSNQQLLELPQIRILEEFDAQILPLALWCNTDVIWIHPMANVFRSTLGYNLNQSRVPTVVIELGTSHRVHRPYARQILSGLVRLMCHTGVINRPPPPADREPRVINPQQVGMVQARQSGLFVRCVQPGDRVVRGQSLGELIDPRAGTLVEDVKSPYDGLLFTIRELPLTYEGTPLARVVLDSPEGA